MKCVLLNKSAKVCWVCPTRPLFNHNQNQNKCLAFLSPFCFQQFWAQRCLHLLPDAMMSLFRAKVIVKCMLSLLVSSTIIVNSRRNISVHLKCNQQFLGRPSFKEYCAEFCKRDTKEWLRWWDSRTDNSQEKNLARSTYWWVIFINFLFPMHTDNTLFARLT